MEILICNKCSSFDDDDNIVHTTFRSLYSLVWDYLRMKNGIKGSEKGI